MRPEETADEKRIQVIVYSDVQKNEIHRALKKRKANGNVFCETRLGRDTPAL